MMVYRVCESTCGNTAGRNDCASSRETNSSIVPPSVATATYTPDFDTLKPTPLCTTRRVLRSVRNMSVDLYTLSLLVSCRNWWPFECSYAL